MIHIFRIPTKPGYHGVNLGFRVQDQRYLDLYDNPTVGPEVNIVASYAEDEDEEEQIKGPDYCCADCTGLLDHNNILKDQYHCRQCSKFYNITKDRLLTRLDVQEDGVVYVTSGTKKYEKYEDYIEQGSKIQPFIESINSDTLDTDQNRGYEVTYKSRRIEHRKVTDMSKLGEAIAF